MEAPHPAPWRDAPAGRVPPWGCGPRPLQSASLTAPLGKNRQHVRHDQHHPVRVRLSSLAQRRLVPQTREELSVQSRSCGLRGGLSPGLPGPRPRAPCTAPSQAPESHACGHCSGPRSRGPSHHAERETATGLSLLLHPHGQHPAKASSSPDWVQA